jgi:NAD+ synthase (glutamine-hydrolysing)
MEKIRHYSINLADWFAIIKNVAKILVYKLSLYRNHLGQVIPECVLTKEPSYALKPDQKDKDTLPVYGTLDPILKAYIEEGKDLDEIISCRI